MIEIENLHFRYSPDSPEVLRGISLTLQPGESVSIMGANGSGKSTLARCLNGLLRPTSGRVVVNGLAVDSPESLLAVRKLVGMVFQNPDNQIVSTTVEREIAFGLENLGVPHDQMIAKVDQALHEFRLSRYRKRPPHHLSGGERQLLALAAVLVMEPKYLVLDEPTSLLDPASRKQLLNTVFASSSSDKHDFTPILITQFPEEAMYTQRLIVLDQGQVLFDDAPQNVFRHTDELIAAGIGVPIEFLLEECHAD